jgi:hypothetical protein
LCRDCCGGGDHEGDEDPCGEDSVFLHASHYTLFAWRCSSLAAEEFRGSGPGRCVIPKALSARSARHLKVIFSRDPYK